jgi:hypothetical protein
MFQQQSAEARGAVRLGIAEALRQQFDIPDELPPDLARLSRLLERGDKRHTGHLGSFGTSRQT